ncbi:universal stress protein [Yunchengibacter salinarum]|uniref:universal stress protein n=1 Tax=Yunchengibacter salinarum TaxID=3133399 RepID=UPI0035B66D59
MGKQLYMVAVDGSEWGNRAADRAITLARQTGAKVRLITVIPWSGIQPLTLDEMAHRPLDKKQEEATAKQEILDAIMKKHEDSGVDISGEFFWGHPVETIHETAKREKANMIFVGRRGRSKVADLLLGSVANSLAHTAGVPVVLVP